MTLCPLNNYKALSAVIDQLHLETRSRPPRVDSLLVKIRKIFCNAIKILLAAPFLLLSALIDLGSKGFRLILPQDEAPRKNPTKLPTVPLEILPYSSDTEEKSLDPSPLDSGESPEIDPEEDHKHR